MSRASPGPNLHQGLNPTRLSEHTAIWEGVPKVGEDRGIRGQQQDRNLRPDQGEGTAGCYVAKSRLLSGRLGVPTGSSHSFICLFIPPVCVEHQTLTRPCWMCWRHSKTDRHHVHGVEGPTHMCRRGALQARTASAKALG